MISERKIRVYGLLFDVGMKFVLSVVVTIAFVAVTIKLLLNPQWPIAGADGALSLSITTVIRHYFPRRDAGDDK